MAGMGGGWNPWLARMVLMLFETIFESTIRNVLTGKEAKTEILQMTRILYFWLMLKLLDNVIIPRFDILQMTNIHWILLNYSNFCLDEHDIYRNPTFIRFVQVNL